MRDAARNCVIVQAVAYNVRVTERCVMTSRHPSSDSWLTIKQAMTRSCARDPQWARKLLA